MPFSPHLRNALLKRGGVLSENNDSVIFKNGNEVVSFKGTGKGLPQEEILVTFNGVILDLSRWFSPETSTLKTGKNIVKNIYGTYVDCINICNSILEDLGFLELGNNKKYGKRKINFGIKPSSESTLFIIPPNFNSLIKNIRMLYDDQDHKERAHESLVQDYYELLGYNKIEEIKYRIGRIDVCIKINDKPLIVTEVKKDWKLTRHHVNVVEQAYNYANEVGVAIVVITNGDYYSIFNRRKGLSYKENLVGEFNLTKLTEDKIGLITWLGKENLNSLIEDYKPR